LAVRAVTPMIGAEGKDTKRCAGGNMGAVGERNVRIDASQSNSKKSGTIKVLFSLSFNTHTHTVKG
jgi:hypothetical protein